MAGHPSLFCCEVPSSRTRLLTVVRRYWWNVDIKVSARGVEIALQKSKKHRTYGVHLREGCIAISQTKQDSYRISCMKCRSLAGVSCHQLDARRVYALPPCSKLQYINSEKRYRNVQASRPTYNVLRSILSSVMIALGPGGGENKISLADRAEPKMKTVNS